MRVTLPNGDWVDLVERLNYAQARRINMASGTPESGGTVVAAMVTGWALRDTEDQAIPFPDRADEGIPLDALSRIPFDTFQAIGEAAVDILPGQPDPKGSGKQSPVSAGAGRLPSPTNSRRSTSSQTIQGGTGPISSGHPRT